MAPARMRGPTPPKPLTTTPVTPNDTTEEEP